MTLPEIADKLYHADRFKEAIAPIRGEIAPQDLHAAYQIQEYNTRRQATAGHQIVGKKIGLTSKKVQAQLGVDQPDFGILLDHMQVKNGDEIPYAELLQPKVEAEVAFVMKKDLAYPKLNLRDVISAIDYAVPAIEIVGSRIKDWDIHITDTIADNASSSHFVLGDSRINLKDIDLEACRMQLLKNGKIASEGNGKACLGNPLNAVLWLARKMQSLGHPLKTGEVILSGALGPMVVIDQGNTINAAIEGLGEVGFKVGREK